MAPSRPPLRSTLRNVLMARCSELSVTMTFGQSVSSSSFLETIRPWLRSRWTARIGDEQMSDRVRWIRSYVVEEADGRIGTFCVYEARDGESIREHARRVGMPADEIHPIATTVIIRDDPAAASVAA